MKRIMAILISCILVLSLVGCSESGGRYDVGSSYRKYFTVIDSTPYGVTIYANDTRVIYYSFYNDLGGGITPLYNADGTLQIYNGE